MSKLFIFITLSFLNLNIHLSAQESSETLAKALVEAIRTEDYTALKKLMLTQDDLLKINECECAEGLTDKLTEYQNYFMSNFFEAHDNLLKTGLPMNTLKFEACKVRGDEGTLSIRIHISNQNFHGIIKTSAIKTSIGLKLVKKFDLSSSADRLKEYFGLIDAQPFNWSYKKVLFDDDRSLTNKTSTGKTDMGDFSRIDYYSNDSIYSSVFCFPEQNICAIKHLYRNGYIQDSVAFKVKDKTSLQLILKPVKSSAEMSNPNVIIKDILYSASFHFNGKIRESESKLSNDTILKRKYRLDGNVEFETKKYHDQIISEKKSDYLGKLDNYKRFYNKVKAETMEELRTFPEYSTIYKRYNGGLYEMPAVEFVKRPEGWFVKLIETGTEYSYWSFQTQTYIYLPKKPFLTGMQKSNMSIFEIIPIPEHPEFTLFYGYPEANRDAISIALPNYNSLPDKELGALSLVYRNELLPLIYAEDLNIENELKSRLDTFTLISEKMNEYGGLEEMYQILELRKGKSIADSLIKSHKICKQQESYNKVCLNECENGAILLTPYAAILISTQNQYNYRKDVTIINLDLLSYKWYRVYVENIFSVKPGDIFKLSPDFYDKDIFRNKIKQIEKDSEVSVDVFLSNLRKNETNSIPDLIQFKNRDKDNSQQLVGLIKIDSVFLSDFGISTIELINHIYYSLNKNSLYSQKWFRSWAACMQYGFFSEKLVFGADGSCPDEFESYAKKFLSSPDLNQFWEPMLSSVFSSVSIHYDRKPQKSNNDFKEIYDKTSKLYKKKWAKDSYEEAIDLVKTGFESGYPELAKALLKKCFINQTDICYLLEYYDNDKIDHSNRELKEFLIMKNLKTIQDIYFKD
jgi:hypothetical protein